MEVSLTSLLLGFIIGLGYTMFTNYVRYKHRLKPLKKFQRELTIELGKAYLMMAVDNKQDLIIKYINVKLAHIDSITDISDLKLSNLPHLTDVLSLGYIEVTDEGLSYLENALERYRDKIFTN